MQLELSQKTGLTTALQTSMHLLQLNTLQLRSYLGETMLGNAVAELEFPQVSSYVSPFGRRPRATGSASASLDDEQTPKEQYMAAQEGGALHDLLLQAAMLQLPAEQHRILKYMVYSLDSSGFLTEPLENIAAALSVPQEEVAVCLALLQRMEPPGIGATGLRECLRLQLERTEPVDTLALRIVEGHLKELAARQYGSIAKALSVSRAEVTRACDVIRALNPRPLNGQSSEATTQYIFPDFCVLEEGGQLHAVLNDYYLPKIVLNPEYVRLMHSTQLNEADREYMQRDYKQAGEIIHFLSYRKSTLQRVIEYVLTAQRDFFLLGPGHRNSMNYHELAEQLSLHESTVSRAVNGKFFECKWGVFPLRSLFLHDVGKKASSLDQILLRIQQLIEAEPPGNAYSDQQLIALLEEDGLHIARRTVAKYRQQLGIPPASSRNRQQATR